MYEIPSIKSLGILADIGSAKKILNLVQSNIGSRIVNIR
jgi:hypothetical protein